MKILMLIGGIILCLIFPPLIVFVGIGCTIYMWASFFASIGISKASKAEAKAKVEAKAEKASAEAKAKAEIVNAKIDKAIAEAEAKAQKARAEAEKARAEAEKARAEQELSKKTWRCHRCGAINTYNHHECQNCSTLE